MQKVEFARDGIRTTAKADYPSNPPSEEEETQLAQNAALLFCPGCSNQEVCLGRCHGSILAEHIGIEVPVQGMQGIFKASEMISLIDGKGNMFVGRKAPRGVKTKSIGVQKTLHRSKFANPFIVSKKNFRLGESLALYKKWVNNKYKPLTAKDVQETINTASLLPETVEELLKEQPNIFDALPTKSRM